jgi:uncharacterized repeat protein (TIGR03803 family)
LGGSSQNDGTVFEINSSGRFSVLAVFNGQNGAQPQASLVMDRQGNLYGTTTNGGPGNDGSHAGDGNVFQLTTPGQLTTLHNFNRTDGLAPYGGLVMDRQGNLYGTTTFGGTTATSSFIAYGTIFKIDSGGRFSTLYNFNGRNEDAYPMSSMLLEARGDLFGTTTGLGGNGHGAVFELMANGQFSNVNYFRGENGMYPLGDLTTDSQDNIYGTTAYGGTKPGPSGYGGGTVFQLTPTVVPEPPARALMGTGLLILGVAAWKLRAPTRRLLQSES